MAIKNRIADRPARRMEESLQDKLYREERAYRADKLVEKWSRVPEIGKGIKDLNTNTARNLAILLENQRRSMSRMTEAQLSANFFDYTPENMLRLVRLAYPNSIRGDLFTEFAMETSHDSIKYVLPVYTNAQKNDFDCNDTPWSMDNRFDDLRNKKDVMYESSESRYATELVNVADENITAAAGGVAVSFNGGALEGNYIPRDSALYIVVDGDRRALAIQDSKGEWFGGKDIHIVDDLYIKVGEVEQVKTDATFSIFGKIGVDGEYKPVSFEAGSLKFGDEEVLALTKGVGADGFVTWFAGKTAFRFAAVGRFDSERDLTGKYLGEVELQMKDYHFRPRAITLGVTWTKLTELVLDTSFGLSAEEMLMDSAAQEIKKTLDYQAVKYASDVQKVHASSNFVQFDAAAGDATKDSYWHTAQIVNQALGHVEDNMLNEFGRGGITAIVGGPKAVRYLELNEGWSNKGAQPKIGGHKVGELNGVPVFKVPEWIIPDDQLLTTWKNDQAEGDVAIAIGTLVPFYSTGALQRKNLYTEAAVARFEDMQALQPKYLGRVQIKNVR